jgi:hypothetical protein
MSGLFSLSCMPPHLIKLLGVFLVFILEVKNRCRNTSSFQCCTRGKQVICTKGHRLGGDGITYPLG